MLRSILKFSFFTVVSKVFGFLRDVVLVGALGIGPLSDVFFIAFRLPNLFRAILADGALNMVLTPMFTSKRTETGFKPFVNNLFTIMSTVTIGFSVACVLCMPILVIIFAPGLDVDSSYFSECVRMSRIMFPYLFFATVVAFISSLLQSDKKFFFVSFSPVILNVAMIVAALSSFIKRSAITISWSVVIGGVIQLALGLLCLRLQSKNTVRFVTPKVDEDVKLTFDRLLPAVMGACATRVSIWIDTVIASTIQNAVTYIYYADRLYQIPRSLVGVAISYVMLPELSSAVKGQDHARAHKLLNRALEVGFMLCIPAAVGLATLADRASNLLLTYGGLSGADHAEAIARIIVVLSVAIPPVTASSVLNTMFFASGNTSLPFRLSLISVTVNVLVNLVAITPLGYMSVPVATSVGAWLNFGLLFYFVRKRYIFTIDSRFTYKVGMSCVSAFLMSVVVCAVEVFFEGLSNYMTGLGFMLLLCSLGAVTYIVSLRLTSTYSMGDFKNMFDSM